MLWSKNKEGKKAGTTLIGICKDGCAALGTDFDEKKSAEDEIGVVENFHGCLIGYTGPKRCIDGFEHLKSAIERGDSITSAAEETAAFWKIESAKAVDAFVVVLDGERSIVIAPGTAQSPKADMVAVGPGEQYALAAIRAILAQPVVQESAQDMVKKAFEVASGVCVLVNSGAKILQLEK